MQIEKKFYNEKHRPYYICAPGFTRVSNGVRAMHLLCHYLNKLGEEAYVFTPETDPKLRTPYLTQDIVDRHKATKRSPIVVYPEVLHGNPLNATSVVRYILNHPGLLGGPKDYPESDMLVFWHQDYVDFAKYADPSYIFIPSIDTGIFNNDDNPHDDERHLTLVYPGRYKTAEQDFPELFKDSTVITYDWPQSHEELAALLRQGRVVYTFANSAIISEALLCGCPVVIKETVYSKKPEERAGVALGLALPGATFDDTPEGIAAAHAKTVEYQQVYHQYQLELLGQLEHFIDRSQLLPQGAGNEVVLPSFQPQAAPVSQEEASYDAWMRRHALTPASAQLHAERMIRSWSGQPRFIILMPLTMDGLPDAIRSINSLSQQLYKQWQLILVADFDEPSAVFQNSEILGWLRIDNARDPAQLTQAYAAVLGALPCDWMGILPPGAELEPHALIALGDYAALNPAWQAIYSDSDIISRNGKRSQPAFKPDFNLDLLRGSDYVGDGAWFRAEALQEVGAFAEAPDADSYDALLRIHDRYGAMVIGHIPDMLLHAPSRGTADGSGQRAALDAHLARNGGGADIEAGPAAGTRRIRYPAPEQARLSIIVADAGDGFHLSPCIDALQASLGGCACEILAIATDGEPGDAAKLLRCDPGLGLAARFQLGAEAASGDFLLFIDSRVELAQPDGLQALLGLAARPEVGAAAPRLLRPDGEALWRGPLLIGAGEGAAALFCDAGASEAGHLNRQAVEHNPGALRLECLLMAKAFYQQIGGMDASLPTLLDTAVDLGLRIRAAGRLPVWTPFVSARRHGALDVSEPPETCDADALSLRWNGWLGQDPAHNRHLSLAADKAFQIDDVYSAQWDASFHERTRVLALPAESKATEARMASPFRILQEDCQCQLTQIPAGQRLPSAGEIERMAPDALLMSARFDSASLAWLRGYRQRRPDVLAVLMLDKLDFGAGTTHRYGQSLLQAMAGMADRVIVPTESLYRMALAFADDVRLVPDGLEEARWFELQSLRRVGKKPRVGWVGSAAEAPDLLMLSGIILATAAELDWIVIGDCPEVLKPCLAEYHAFDLSSDDYPTRLASLSLDMAVMPKAATLANETGSPLRMFEFGALGVPVICSAVGELGLSPAPVARVKNDVSSWGEALRELARDAAAAAQAGDGLRAWVRENCGLKRHLPLWQQAISR
ncbi:glycosyltransferase [Chromobacterium violaceum]|uniref:hypothetical protein n=1 Tax=Chromobacterium violaceum TaxID=536 RepID=UPI001CE1D22C|nr:hypothetical protein [Chromobacterium violaceum]